MPLGLAMGKVSLLFDLRMQLGVASSSATEADISLKAALEPFTEVSKILLTFFQITASVRSRPGCITRLALTSKVWGAWVGVLVATSDIPRRPRLQ